MRITKNRAVLGGLLTAMLWAGVCAQEPSSQSLTLDAAVAQALREHPALRLAQAQLTTAGAGVELARTSYLPRADLLWQQNVATRNNVMGLLFPQATIPPISGPVLDATSMKGAGGSAAGLLVSWEPFDFGLRKANEELARAGSQQAERNLEASRLEIATIAADAFLGLLAAEQAVRAARANVERMAVFAKAVQAMVDAQLRPGVDASRAAAELAGARNQLIQAEQNAEVGRAQLAEAIGRAGTPVRAEAGPLLSLPPEAEAPAPDLAGHPLVRLQAAAIDTVRAREHALDRAFVPRFNLQSAVFGRGSSALVNGGFHYAHGWYPNTPDWAVGMTMTFSATDVFGLRARRHAEAGNEAAERARYDQTVQTLKTQEQRARILLDSARRIAANTPLQLKAAQETELRARVRYENGLTGVVEVADAQRLLAQAEVDDAIARLAVWRALLAAARVRGDLGPFLQATAR